MILSADLSAFLLKKGKVALSVFIKIFISYFYKLTETIRLHIHCLGNRLLKMSAHLQIFSSCGGFASPFITVSYLLYLYVR